MLTGLLRAENVVARRYFYPGVHRCIPYAEQLSETEARLPNTDSACATSVQFPIGARVSPDAVDRICEIIGAAHKHAAEIRSRHDKT